MNQLINFFGQLTLHKQKSLKKYISIELQNYKCKNKSIWMRIMLINNAVKYT